jgi:hypothetical protein
VPAWLPGAIKHAQKEGWRLDVMGSTILFDHDEHDPVTLAFPLGDEAACRDELFKHISYTPYGGFLKNFARTKRIGGKAQTPSPARSSGDEGAA